MTDNTSTGMGSAPPAFSGGVLSRRALRTVLARLAFGTLTVITPGGERIEHRAPGAGPSATLILVRWRALRRLMFGGGIGFAEAYMDGDWTTPDLRALLEFAALNRPGLMRLISASLPARAVNRLFHALRGNTRGGSKRNIMAHYDLGNDFYRLWLDRGMQYSAALYAHPGQSLEDAQEAKLDLIADRLGIGGGESVLEIGCGWGALAERLARSGCRVTGVTLSPAQLAYARARLSAMPDTDLRLQDYRDIGGRFDRIVSIEMIEAVGRDYWPTYFAALRERLADGGRAVIQAITISEDRYDAYAGRVDFIQRYIFPGGMLPTKTIMARQTTGAGLHLTDAVHFGLGYAETLAEWRRRFHAAWPQLKAQGFSETFRRMWDYYLVYCEVGFRSGDLDVGLYTIEKR